MIIFSKSKPPPPAETNAERVVPTTRHGVFFFFRQRKRYPRRSTGRIWLAFDLHCYESAAPCSWSPGVVYARSGPQTVRGPRCRRNIVGYVYLKIENPLYVCTFGSHSEFSYSTHPSGNNRNVNTAVSWRRRGRYECYIVSTKNDDSVCTRSVESELMLAAQWISRCELDRLRSDRRIRPTAVSCLVTFYLANRQRRV